jgi:hypothetical protein
MGQKSTPTRDLLDLVNRSRGRKDVPAQVTRPPAIALLPASDLLDEPQRTALLLYAIRKFLDHRVGQHISRDALHFIPDGIA